MDLILLAAGNSSRFKRKIPKYLLPMADGRPMIAHAIEPFLDQVDQIHIVIQNMHNDKFNAIKTINTAMGSRAGILTLPSFTNGPAETASRVCRFLGNLPVFIKDCDSFFNAKLPVGNFVCTTEHTENDLSKSYVTHKHGSITGLEEKTPVGTTISTGGYGFAKASSFIKAYDVLEHTRELYISDVINLLLEKEKFDILPVDNYQYVGVPKLYTSIINR